MAARCVALTGGLVLAGWLLDIPAFKSVMPGLATMKANTALCLLLAGASRVWASAPMRSRRVGARIGGWAVVAISALSGLQYALQIDLGLDQLLFRDPESTVLPGRMAPATAVGLFFAGCGVLALAQGRPRMAMWCVVPTLAVSWLAIVGYVYDVSALYNVGAYSSMAVHTAASLMALGLSVLIAPVDMGLAAIATSDTSGGVLARHVLPALPLVVLTAGWVWLWLERRGWYDPAFMSAMRTVSLTVVGGAAVAIFSLALHESELKRRRLSEALADKRAEALLDAAPDPIMVVDGTGRIVLLNVEAERQFGYRRGELVGEAMNTVLAPPSHGVYSRHLDSVVRSAGRNAQIPLLDLHGRRKDGGEFPVEVTFSPLMTKDGLLISCAMRDVSSRRHAEETEARLAAIVASSDAAICSVTPDGSVQTWNRGAEQLFGYARAEMEGRRIVELVAEARRESECRIITGAAGGSPVLLHPAELLRKDGSTVDVAVTASPIRNRQGAVTAVSIIARDITEQRAAERRLQASIAEKETLLREVHHRVKNNLAVVSSLLYLETTQTREPAALRILEDARQRVRSMAAVHETLYRSGDFSRLDLGAFIATLVSDLRASFGAAAARIAVRVDGAMDVSLTVAVPSALIVNELVTNCLKHAFVDGREGEVLVSLIARGGTCTMTVRDDGVGIPADLDVATASSLGLRLVRTLAAQLDGEFTIERLTEGSIATLSFSDGERG